MLAAGRFYAVPEPTYVYNKHPAHIGWNAEKVLDLLRGLDECMALAEENHLPRLYNKALTKLEEFFARWIVRYFDGEILRQLVHMEDRLDVDLANEGAGETRYPADYRLRVLDRAWSETPENKKYTALRAAPSFRLGRALTAPLRAIRRLRKN